MTDNPRRPIAITGVVILLLALGYAGALPGADALPASAAASSPVDPVQAHGQFGETRLHWMVFHGDEPAVRELVDAGADINARIDKGATPLHLAAYKGHAEIARLLLARGARVNVQTDAGVTPLDWAVRNSHREVTDVLLAHGATHGPHWQGPKLTTPTSPAPPPAPAAPLALELPPQTRVQPHDIAADSRSSGAGAARADVATDSGGFAVQLGAFSSEPRALAAWQGYRERHPEILDGLPLAVDSVAREGQTLYRVRAGRLGQRSHAVDLCARLIQRQQPCQPVVLRAGVAPQR